MSTKLPNERTRRCNVFHTNPCPQRAYKVIETLPPNNSHRELKLDHDWDNLHVTCCCDGLCCEWWLWSMKRYQWMRRGSPVVNTSQRSEFIQACRKLPTGKAAHFLVSVSVDCKEGEREGEGGVSEHDTQDAGSVTQPHFCRISMTGQNQHSVFTFLVSWGILKIKSHESHLLVINRKFRYLPSFYYKYVLNNMKS